MRRCARVLRCLRRCSRWLARAARVVAPVILPGWPAAALQRARRRGRGRAGRGGGSGGRAPTHHRRGRRPTSVCRSAVRHPWRAGRPTPAWRDAPSARSCGSQSLQGSAFPPWYAECTDGLPLPLLPLTFTYVRKTRRVPPPSSATSSIYFRARLEPLLLFLR